MGTASGTFIVLEGTDGSGKTTQWQTLASRLRDQGYSVSVFDFPQYGQPSSYFVREYLNGSYGAVDEVGPYTAALFYALDRYEAAPKIRKALDDGNIVLVNRYVGSNMAHQGAKFNNAEERRGFFIWLDNLEYEMLRIPRPLLSIVLDVPAHIAQELVDRKAPRDYTSKKRDIHEADMNHLERSVSTYEDLCKLFPKDFFAIDCTRSGHIMSEEAIADIIWQKVLPLLPAHPHTKSVAAGVTQNATIVENPFVIKDEAGQFHATKEGKAFLDKTVTNADKNVYAFTPQLSPITVAAAMARLSRRGDDMRITLLDEFAHTSGKDERLLQRVITAYGDDSVQQLAGLHVVVEQASNILTKKLEWGRLGAYLEQSTRYIYFDQKDMNGHYRYHVPETLDLATKKQYEECMDTLFDTYSNLVHQMTDYLQTNATVPVAERDAAWRSAIKAQACDAIRPVLPTATTSTVGIFASGQALESLVIHLLSDPLPEAQKTGELILQEVRKVAPVFFERADKPDRGGAAVVYRSQTRQAIEDITRKYVPDYHAAQSHPVQLVDVWPRNELDLVPDMLYEYSNLSLRDLQRQVGSWTYDQKLSAFEAYMGERLNRRHRPGRALEKAHYSWDLVCDYGIFRDLQRHRMVDDLTWQELTPRYGYEVPKLVDEAGLADEFEACFDISLKLYSLLQQAGYQHEAQYATLLGHRMRWKVTYNAREAFHLHELRTSPQGHPGYRKLVQHMHEKLCEVHPLLGEAMKFVNQGEDPELTRLAAERYTAYKLQQLKNTD